MSYRSNPPNECVCDDPMGLMICRIHEKKYVEIEESQLRELRAKAARCDAYEREGEALVDVDAMLPHERADGEHVARAQLARDRALVEAAIAKYEAETHGGDVAALMYAVREALQ